MATYANMAAAIPPNCLRRSSSPHKGRRGICWRRIAGSSTMAWAATPSVVPMPSTNSFGSLIRIGSRVSSPGISQYSTRVPIATRLFHTGAQAGGPNTLRVFRIAMNSELRP
ncbi:Uncharacterised protein [Mycobacteroides abscessus subsp. abscessus]|nr:Uncharacterised protein [Mycobacteroides abscessus subsp. abscessus]